MWTPLSIRKYKSYKKRTEELLMNIRELKKYMRSKKLMYTKPGKIEKSEIHLLSVYLSRLEEAVRNAFWNYCEWWILTYNSLEENELVKLEFVLRNAEKNIQKISQKISIYFY